MPIYVQADLHAYFTGGGNSVWSPFSRYKQPSLDRGRMPTDSQ